MKLSKEQEEKLYPKVASLVEVMRKKYDGMLDGMEPALSVDIAEIAAQLLEAQRKEIVWAVKSLDSTEITGIATVAYSMAIGHVLSLPQLTGKKN